MREENRSRVGTKGLGHHAGTVPRVGAQSLPASLLRVREEWEGPWSFHCSVWTSCAAPARPGVAARRGSSCGPGPRRAPPPALAPAAPRRQQLEVSGGPGCLGHTGRLLE